MSTQAYTSDTTRLLAEAIPVVESTNFFSRGMTADIVIDEWCDHEGKFHPLESPKSLPPFCLCDKNRELPCRLDRVRLAWGCMICGLDLDDHTLTGMGLVNGQLRTEN